MWSTLSSRLRKLDRTHTGRIVALSCLLLVSSSSALAQCTASFSSMVAAAAVARSQSPLAQLPASDKLAANDNAVNASIVGLWHIRFQVGGQDIQEAFQIWNTGGTEVHNPNVDPRGGNVCLGTWTEQAPHTFKLTHRVWLYDSNGNFQGVGHLSEALLLGDRGNTHTGSFTLTIFDPFGNQVDQVSGTVVGERISPE